MSDYSRLPTFKAEIRRIFLNNKLRWAYSFFAFQILPLVEIALIAAIYAMLKQDEKNIFQTIATNTGLFPSEMTAPPQLIYWISGTAFLLLITQTFLRYKAEINLARLRIAIYFENALRLMECYFMAQIVLVRRIGRERIISSVINDCGAVGDYIKIRLDLLGGLWGILLYLVSAIVISWQVLIVAMAIYALPFYVNRNQYQRMRQIGKQKVQAQEMMQGFFADVLSSFQRCRIDGLEKALKEETVGVLNASQKWRLSKHQTQINVRNTMESLSLFGVLVIIFVGTTVIRLDLSLLLLFFVVFSRMRGYVTIISNSLLEIRSQAPHIERYVALLDELKGNQISPHYPAAHSDTLTPKSFKIECRDVSFAYNQNKAVLKNVSFILNPGDRILLSGPSGEGKSSLLEIIAGLISPNKGMVLYNDKTLDDSLFHQIRSFISFASPTIHLFRGTLRYNLSIGIEDSEANINEAARLAGLDITLSELERGLDTVLGDDGDKLSLGQRQRVILARIFLKRPKLVLLDEATANLDPILEAELIDRLQAFIEPDCIIFMVSHKAPVNFKYNKRFELSGGRLFCTESLKPPQLTE
jgi:ABC-type bacteriocin/lantibiotic exporter with double-glycine peptidase domain